MRSSDMSAERRTGEQAVVSFGAYGLYSDERLLVKSGVPVPIGGRALDILIALTDQAGEVVSGRALLQRVWPDAIVEEVTLRGHVAALRRALGDGLDGARYVLNVPGRGYAFVAPIYRSAAELLTAVDHQMTRSRSSSLPSPRLSLTGRDETVAKLCEQLLTQRFVSVVGPGGIGKTAVAVAVANALCKNFKADDVFFIDLGSLDHKADVASAIASGLGCSVLGLDPQPFILAALAKRKVLIVLDSCEHVIESVAPLCQSLFVGTSFAHLLTTSREALRVFGENVYLLSPLEGPIGDVHLAAEALKFPVVQLFMKQAHRNGYHEPLSDSEAPIVSSICRRLDGIALAIELVASRVGSYGIQGIADLLGQEDTLQWRGQRTASRRHQTMRAMLDWSFSLLQPEDQDALCMLSVFVGEFTVHAARAITADATHKRQAIAGAINSLVDKSLISTMPGREHVSYRLLDTTRAYTAAKLNEKGNPQAVARRHAIYFADLLKEITTEGPSFDGRDAATYALHLGNVRRALAWSFSEFGDSRIGVRLASYAAPLLLGLSQFGECQKWCRLAIACLAGGEQDVNSEFRLFYALARSAVYAQGDANAAQLVFTRALYLAEELGDEIRQLDLLADFNVFVTRLGDHRAAIETARKSVNLAERTGGAIEKALAAWMLGASYHAGGDQAAALSHCKHGFRLAASLAPARLDLLSEVRALFALARSLWLQGFPDQAAESVRQTVVKMANYSHHVSYCFALVYTIPVMLWCGDFEAAAEPIERAVAYATKNAPAILGAAALAHKGELLVELGELTAGIETLENSLQPMLADPYHIAASPTSCALAKALAKSGRFNEAKVVVDAAMVRAHRSDEQCWMPDLLRTRGEILLMTPELTLDAGQDDLVGAMACARRQSALGWELKAAIPLARLWRDRGRIVEARSMLDAVYLQFSEGFGTRDLIEARRFLDGSDGA
jgi:predicted ATPase/DNA-binding winged helix-turn-helix (wHTH) protein